MSTTTEITNLPRGTHVTVKNAGSDVYEVASEVLYDVIAKNSFVLLSPVTRPHSATLSVLVTQITVL